LQGEKRRQVIEKRTRNQKNSLKKGPKYPRQRIAFKRGGAAVNTSKKGRG